MFIVIEELLADGDKPLVGGDRNEADSEMRSIL